MQLHGAERTSGLRRPEAVQPCVPSPADRNAAPAPTAGDATSATGRRILGVPLYVSPYVAANTLWAIDASRVWLVVRDDAAVEADRSVFFTSDRVAVKATMRAAFGFVHPQALVKVGVA